jgi:hypothetical protein
MITPAEHLFAPDPASHTRESSHSRRSGPRDPEPGQPAGLDQAIPHPSTRPARMPRTRSAPRAKNKALFLIQIVYFLPQLGKFEATGTGHGQVWS